MRRLAIFSVFLALLTGTEAHADEFYKLVRYACQAKKDAVAVTYVGANYEARKDLVRAKGANAWAPSALVEYGTDGMVSRIHTVRRKCRLSDGEYEVAISGKTGNANVQGECGLDVTARLRVSKDAKVLYSGPFEEHCHGNHPVVTSVVIKAGNPSPVITKVSSDQFFR